MKVLLTIVCIFGSMMHASAQSPWSTAGMPFKSVGVIEMYADSLTDALYCAGFIQQNQDNSWGDIILAKYDSAGWHELGLFGNALWTVVNYQDTIIVGGAFLTVDSMPIQYLAAYYDSAWHSMGSFNGKVSQLRILDGELYAVGSFSTLNGQIANGAAKYENGNWHPFPVSPPATIGGGRLCYDVNKYQGDIYIGGSFSLTTGPNDLIRFNGSNWVAVGTGIQGGFSWVNQLEVYEGELYVGGLFDNAAGNAGNAIMRWDGTNWNSLGDGLQSITGTYDPNMSVFALTEHDGMLFVGGGQHFAGYVPSMFISSWDGQQWCNVGNAVFDNVEVRNIESFHDTLFISSGFMIDGDSVNLVAKWVGSAYSDTCGPVNNVDDNEHFHDPQHKPSAIEHNGQWTIVGWQEGLWPLQVFDARGNLVYAGQVRVQQGRSTPFQLNDLNSGIYLLHSADLQNTAVRILLE